MVDFRAPMWSFVPAQTIQIANYEKNSVNKSIGFKITENIIQPETTTSLLDNAQGSTNYAAKGAHRLQISLDLVAIDKDADKTDFVALAEITNSLTTREVRNTEYSHIADTFARRTFDESGNYTVAFCKGLRGMKRERGML